VILAREGVWLYVDFLCLMNWFDRLRGRQDNESSCSSQQHETVCFKIPSRCMIIRARDEDQDTRSLSAAIGRHLLLVVPTYGQRGRLIRIMLRCNLVKRTEGVVHMCWFRHSNSTNRLGKGTRHAVNSSAGVLERDGIGDADHTRRQTTLLVHNLTAVYIVLGM
jgi:hypothetical protein